MIISAKMKIEYKQWFCIFLISDNGPMAQEMGTINANGDVNLKLYFDGECATCYRMYRYKFISDDEIYFRVTYYKDDKETGDFYGGTYVRKSK